MEQTFATPTKEVLTCEEAAQFLGIAKSYLYKLTHRRLIPHYKAPMGKMLYFNVAELVAWMQSCPVVTENQLNAQFQAYMHK